MTLVHHALISAGLSFVLAVAGLMNFVPAYKAASKAGDLQAAAGIRKITISFVLGGVIASGAGLIMAWMLGNFGTDPQLIEFIQVVSAPLSIAVYFPPLGSVLILWMVLGAISGREA